MVITPYTEDDLDSAIAASVSILWWRVNGPSSVGYTRIMAIREAMMNRWERMMPENNDSAIIRQAWRDLSKLGHFDFRVEEDVDA
jgi:hypothetical protein